MISEHVQPSAYVVDDHEFQKWRMQILEGIAKGEWDIQDGRTFTHTEAQDKLNKWFD